MRKKWKAVVCLIGCCGSLMMNVNAKETMNKESISIIDKGEIKPRYTNISKVNVMTQLKSGNVISGFYLSAYVQQKITVNLRLEKYANGYWNTVKSWSESKSSAKSLMLSKTYSASKGYTYRTVAVINCGGEKVTKYSNVVSY